MVDDGPEFLKALLIFCQVLYQLLRESGVETSSCNHGIFCLSVLSYFTSHILHVCYLVCIYFKFLHLFGGLNLFSLCNISLYMVIFFALKLLYLTFRCQLWCQSLLIGVFRPFTFNVIVYMLELKSAIFVFVYCFVFCFCFFFLPIELLEHFFRIQFLFLFIKIFNSEKLDTI